MKRLTFFIIVLVLSYQMLSAQDNYDVLPEDGRNELFHDYLMEEVAKLSDKRKSDLATALTSVESLQELQQELRDNYKMLLGSVPEKTPLNGEVTGTIEMDRYKIEKVLYESWSNHHITANFYIPTTGDGPYPAVVMLCGHIPEAKADGTRYQRVGILFVTNGIATLVVDPIAQAERYQMFNPNLPEELAFVNQSGTREATLLDVGSMMVGLSVTAWELWDSHRSVDYLCSRVDVVDTTRIGCTGSSGGGAQGTYLTAFDSRIKVSAINSYIMNEPTLFSTIGPQTGSQNLSYEGYYGIDHPSYITMFAPKPFMILCATNDFFDVTATHETYDEVKQVYEKLGVTEKIGFFEENYEHGYWKPRREAAIKWFRTWFYGDTSSIVEPEQTIMTKDTLQVTQSGQIMYEFANEKNITDLNVELAELYAYNREKFWGDNSKDSCLNKIRELLMLKEYEDPVSELVDTIDRFNSTIEKIKITSGNDVPVTGLLFAPKNASGELPAVLYVDGRGKETDAASDGIIEKVYVDSGKMVFAIDVRGFGETIDNSSKNESKHWNKEHRNAVISGYVGKTLVGQRVEDIQKALEILLQRDDLNPDSISIVGIDRAVSAVLHAAVLEPKYNKVIIRMDTIKTLLDIVENPYERDNLTHVIPGMLKYYDYPDLIKVMAPREVIYAEEPDLSAIKSLKQKPLRFNLFNNYPNPFNPSTNIMYILDKRAKVSVKIYDIAGQKIATLVQNQTQSPGTYNITWHGIDDAGNKVASGLYLYSLESPDKSILHKMLLIK